MGQSSGGYYGGQRPGNWQQEPQHTIESPEALFSPQNQSAGPAYGQNQAQHTNYEAQQAAAAAAHQQQQRGVSQLTNAVATLGHPPRNTQTPTPGGQAGMNGGGAQPGLEKRGPVEFNHAISYVNKIKVCVLTSKKFTWLGWLFATTITIPPSTIAGLFHNSIEPVTMTNNFHRIGFKTDQKSTSNSWKFSKLINENPNPFKTSTLK
jgi:hypothetical protein